MSDHMMDPTAGPTKRTAGPGVVTKGLALSREAARRGLGAVERLPPAWTPYRDDIAIGDAAVKARARFLFTPLATPALSANGARAGLGPDGAARERGNDPEVPNRPSPALDKPIASRIPDADIGAAAEQAHARMLGLDKPPEAPKLSGRGATAGLGPFVKGSAGDTTRADSMAKALAESVTKVRAAARATTATQSRPIAPMSDASGRAGITGNTLIAAASRGFESKVPKSPVAQDRDRWASGTTARIAGASKGLGLSDMNWGDHRSASRPQPKRTWVGVQGDATESLENCAEACADQKQSNYAAVNKAAPVRELEKETVSSDVCPPLKSGLDMLETTLSRDAYLLENSPSSLWRRWGSRPSLARHGGTRMDALAHPVAKKTKESCSCACTDCGGSGVLAMHPRATTERSSSANVRASSVSRTTSEAASGIMALVEGFAVRRGRDSNLEWFVPVFMRAGRVVLGAEQSGPISGAWHPDARLGMNAGDKLIATVHSHGRSAAFSEEDVRTGDSLGVPMILVVPGAERIRVYDPVSRAVKDWLPPLARQAREFAKTWAYISRNMSGTPLSKHEGAVAGRDTSARVKPRRERSSELRPPKVTPRRVTIGAPEPADSSSVFALSPGPILTPRRPAVLIDEGILERAVLLSTENIDATAEWIWLEVAIAAAKEKLDVTVIPDADLFRAIVAVAQRDASAARGNPRAVLEIAKQEPLHVEPKLLDIIIQFAQMQPALDPVNVWSAAWAQRLAVAGVPQSPVAFGDDFELITPTPTPPQSLVPDAPDVSLFRRKATPKPIDDRYVATLPTPPDADLLKAIIASARFFKSFGAALPNASSQTVLRLAHEAIRDLDSAMTDVWPRHISTDLLSWVIFFGRFRPHPGLLEKALYMVKYSGGSYPPVPQPDSDLLERIATIAWYSQGSHPLDILRRALAEKLVSDLGVGVSGYPCHADESCDAGSLCNWAGQCEKDTWPAQADYSPNQTIPGVEIDRDWTNEVDGIASDGKFWYVVQDANLWKIPDGVAWDQDWGPLDFEALGIIRTDEDNTQTGCKHWGDPDVFAGRIYVPLEDCSTDAPGPTPGGCGNDNSVNGGNQLAEFDAKTLRFIGITPTFTDHAASVAVHPKTQEFYIENNFCAPGVLHVYPPRGPGKFVLGPPVRKIPIDNSWWPVTNIQGIAFSDSGRLYVSSDGGGTTAGVFAYQLSRRHTAFKRFLPIDIDYNDTDITGNSPQEVQGLTIRDVVWSTGARNQIHVILLNNRLKPGKDNVWFKHYSVSNEEV